MFQIYILLSTEFLELIPPLVLEWAKTRGELIQKSFLKNLIFGVFGETEFFETFSRIFF